MTVTPPRFWWDDPECDFAKVGYLTTDGYGTQAYVDLRTLTGDNVHTDEHVELERVDEGVTPTSGKLAVCYYREIE